VSRAAALSEVFYTGSEWVRWGEATIADHRARVDYLTRKRDGIDATIRRHLDTIDTLTAAGVSSLEELS
jgi:hypothetical protein